MKSQTKNISALIIALSLSIFCAKAADKYEKTLSSGNTTIEINTSTGGKFTVKENGGSPSGEYTQLGNITVTGGTHTINFNTTAIVYLNGQIKVTGGTLYIKLGEIHTGGSVIKRYDGNPDKDIPACTGALILVENSSSDVNDCKLYIEGHNSCKFIIHGYGDFKKPAGNIIDGYQIPELTGDGNGKVISHGALISIHSGYVELNKVTLNRNYNESLYGSTSGGAINFYNSANSGAVLKMKNCAIEKCYEQRSGAAMYFASFLEDGGSYIEMENCDTHDCFTYGIVEASGGTYRTLGKSFCTIKMLNCKIHDNISNKASSGVSWGAGRAIPAEFNNCELYNNEGEGGAMGLSSSARIIGCRIHDNIARGSGGGIGFSTYNSNEDIPNFRPFNSNIVLDSNTKIYNNEGLNGGGVYFEIKPMVINSSGEVPWTVIYNNEGKPYETSLSIEGAKIYNNKARETGGGLFFKKRGNTPVEYVTDLNLKYGEIYKNEALGTNGGGFYVQGAIPIKIGVPSEQIYFYDNTAVNDGGAFYVEGGNVTITNGFLGKEGAPNIAKAGNGGAIYLNNGNITFSGGSMSYNKAQKAATGTTSGMGGAVYVNSGNITIDGGTVQRNHAERNGGAVYANGGSTTIRGGEVIYNTADIDGGAMCLNGDLTFDSGTLTDNTALNNGGGAYINGGIVTFSNGTLKSNKALNGGGIYLATGASMEFTDGLIAGNHALKNDKVITTAYNAKSDVSAVNGCGGGIYLQSGASADKKTALTINVVNNFGLYGNTADRAGDDIVAEGVNTSVTVPNVTAMDLKDFEGKDAQPNWYEDYVYVEGGSDSGYAAHSILKYSGGSGKRFKDMLFDGSGDFYNHLVTFPETSRTYSDYVCLSLGYTVLSAIIRATGLNEKENMYFTLEQLVKPDGASEWTVKNTYPVLVIGTKEDSAQRVVRNLLPGQYRVKQFKAGDTPWAWAYTVTDPSAGVIEKLVTKEDGENNLFPFTVEHKDGDENVLHDEEYKVNKMLDNAAIVPGADVEDMKKKEPVHVKF